jgi:dTDP-4-dehydrorhamnose reductase
MASNTIIITGANGQVGKELKQLEAQYPQFQFLLLSREDLPIHHFELVRNFFEATKPGYCINCAAYTAVDKAESEKDLAMLVNGAAVGVLASVCHLFKTKLIHISTDYVFDGNASTPYKEDHPVLPVNYYGATKLKGEELCLSNDPQSIVMRTSWVYSEFGNNFVKTMIRLMQSKESINVVNDQFGSPTYAGDLAKAMMDIIAADASGLKAWQPGIFHYSNNGAINWYQFASAIKALIHSSCAVHPIPSASYPTPAKRPAYSVFDTSKFNKIYGFSIPSWQTSLAVCMDRLKATGALHA